MVKISVVIPTYRRTALLEKCLNALAIQRFPEDDYEVIVVSDGPDEQTKNLVVDFAFSNPQFTYLCTATRQGPAAARNFGWMHARAELIAFTDDDTLPDKYWLDTIVNSYHDEAAIAYTGKVIVPLPPEPTDYERVTAGLEKAEFVTANCICTRQALITSGGFDERFFMAWREDSDLEFKLLQHQVPIVHLPDAIVVHPVRKAPWGISIKEQRKGMFNALLYKKFPRLYRQRIQPAPLWNYYVIVVSALCFVLSLFWDASWLATVSLLCWVTLVVHFISKRLRFASKRMSHVAEMVVTSFVIPFVSVYWQLYGAWRYKTFFL